MLRQEPAYFDVHATTGELLQGLNEDTSAIQLAIGEKVRFNHGRLLFICLSYGQQLHRCWAASQMGNFVDKIVTFCVGMAIGVPATGSIAVLIWPWILNAPIA